MRFAFNFCPGAVLRIICQSRCLLFHLQNFPAPCTLQKTGSFRVCFLSGIIRNQGLIFWQHSRFFMDPLAFNNVLHNSLDIVLCLPSFLELQSYFPVFVLLSEQMILILLFLLRVNACGAKEWSSAVVVAEQCTGSPVVKFTLSSIGMNQTLSTWQIHMQFIVHAGVSARQFCWSRGKKRNFHRLSFLRENLSFSREKRKTAGEVFMPQQREFTILSFSATWRQATEESKLGDLWRKWFHLQFSITHCSLSHARHHVPFVVAVPPDVWSKRWRGRKSKKQIC